MVLGEDAAEDGATRSATARQMKRMAAAMRA